MSIDRPPPPPPPPPPDTPSSGRDPVDAPILDEGIGPAEIPQTSASGTPDEGARNSGAMVMDQAPPQAVESPGTVADASTAGDVPVDPVDEPVVEDGSREGLTDANRAAIDDYTGAGYEEINPALRSEDPTEKAAIEERAQAVSEALSELPSHQGFVFRGTSLSPDQLQRYQPGDVVTEPAFTSASKSSDEMFSEQAAFAIDSVTGRDVSAVSQHSYEQEVLFDRNTSFQVDSALYDEQLGRYIIVLSEVPR